MTTPGSGDEIGRFLTVADAAELLAVDVPTVDELIRSGELPAIRVGSAGPWRVERTQLEVWIEEQYEATRRHSALEPGRVRERGRALGGRAPAACAPSTDAAASANETSTIRSSGTMRMPCTSRSRRSGAGLVQREVEMVARHAIERAVHAAVVGGEVHGRAAAAEVAQHERQPDALGEPRG